MKYYKRLKGISELRKATGANCTVGSMFYEYSSRIITSLAFCQSEIQKIIYASYGQSVYQAGQSLKDISSARSRIDFLASHNLICKDPKINHVFRHVKGIILDVHRLRNCLAHDVWSSSEQFVNCLLLSSLDEEARLMFASLKLEHVEGTRTVEIYKSIIRYISSVKLITLDDLEKAHKDVELCAWCLMQISFIIKEVDKAKSDELKNAFLIFKGISHIFNKEDRLSGVVEWKSSKNKTINI